MVNFIKDLISKLDEYFSKDDKEIIKELKETIKYREESIKALTKTLKEQDVLLFSLQEQIEELKGNIISNENYELEEYWNTNISPSTVYYYARRNEKPQNVLEFFHKENDDIEIITGTNNDVIAKKCLWWVNKNIKYTQKLDKENKGEYWQYANETNNLRTGDYEDGAILMANMMIASGVPYWRIRINAGDVKGGGHAYVTYLKESDNKWYVMDWCYWYKSSGTLWKTAEKYFGIWFSFNTKFAFKKSEFDR